MSKPLQSYYEATKYLGQYVSKNITFLKDTACMNFETRQTLAVIEAFIKITKDQDDKDHQDFIKFLKKKAKPFLELWGWANWPRDTVTDMALQKGLESTDEYFDTEKDEDNS